MIREETILDATYKEASSNEVKDMGQSKDKGGKKMSKLEKAAYTAGGAVFGAGFTAVGEAFAATASENSNVHDEEEENASAFSSSESESSTEEAAEEEHGVTIESNGTTVHINGNATVDIENGNIRVSSAASSPDEQPEAPAPEDAIVATASGVRVAQVNDDASFSQAFADARSQVGPGGVFEWHGRAYSTYYKDEWDNMTPEEKHDFQTSIDNTDIISNEGDSHHGNHVEDNGVNQETGNSHAHVTETSADAQEASSDNDVQVLEVGQTDLNGDGIPENAAILEVNGHEVLVVDVDQDGIADAAFCDVDSDGQIEVADLSGENLVMPDMSDGDAYMAQASNAPDYMNDANVGFYEA